MTQLSDVTMSTSKSTIISHSNNNTGSSVDDSVVTQIPPGYWDYPDDFRVCELSGHFMHLKVVVYCVGIMGIVLTVVVLSRKTMCTSTNCYLTALAVADLFVLVLLSAMLMAEYFLSCVRDHEDFLFAFQHIATVFLNVGLFASVWLTVVLAVERYIAICHPMQAMTICTTKRAYIVITTIFFVAFIVRFINFFDMQLVEKKYQDTRTNETKTDIVFEWRTDIYNNTIYSFIVPAFFVGLLPLLSLAVLNIRLVFEIRKSTRYLRYHLAADSRIHSIISQEEKKITMMLIFIVIAFFICQCPYIVAVGIMALSNYVFHHLPNMQLVHDLTVTVLATKSACNFIVYCWFSEKFWMTFKQVFCLRHCLPEQPVVSNGYNGTCAGNHHVNGNGNGNASNCHRPSCFITRETTC